jgi:hypothetical protein
LFSSAAEVVADALRRLGYRVSPRTYPDFGAYFGAYGSVADSAELAFNGWIQDYPAPSNFISGLFACNPYFCDRATERRMRRALAVQARDPPDGNRAVGATRAGARRARDRDSTREPEGGRLRLEASRQLSVAPGLRDAHQPALGALVRLGRLGAAARRPRSVSCALSPREIAHGDLFSGERGSLSRPLRHRPCPLPGISSIDAIESRPGGCVGRRGSGAPPRLRPSPTSLARRSGPAHRRARPASPR